MNQVSINPCDGSLVGSWLVYLLHTCYLGHVEDVSIPDNESEALSLNYLLLEYAKLRNHVIPILNLFKWKEPPNNYNWLDIIVNRDVNFEIHTIILYLVVLVMCAWVLQQMAALPWYITLAHEKYIHSPGGHWGQVQSMANMVKSNTIRLHFGKLSIS